MQERTPLVALMQGKCPRCRQGDIFTYPVKKIGKFNLMNRKCPHCGVLLEPEPGFYQGAMYVGYAFTVAVIVAVAAILSFFGDFSAWTKITVVIVVMFLFLPLNYRYSRIIYLYLFGGLSGKS